MAVRSFHALSPVQQRVYVVIRQFIPGRLRWFYEGCISVPGQLWYAERRLLYMTIRKYNPKIVFEVGTWYGGGSTYFISQALYENGQGRLHTIESDPQLHAAAKANYRRYLAHLVPHVEFHLGDSTEVYPDVLAELGKVDAVFLDGAADAQQTVSEFEMFAPYMGRGSLLVMHDWDDEKMALLRPKIEGSPDGVLVKSISAPHSVGCAVYRHS
ncbi:MAG: O-methyltransferase [Anaerolineae bacterium]